MSKAPYDIVDRPAPKLPLGLRPDGTLTSKAMPFAFILGTIAVFAAFPLGVLGVLLNSAGMERVKTNPEKARKLVAWSWIVFVVTDLVAILAITAMVTLS